MSRRLLRDLATGRTALVGMQVLLGTSVLLAGVIVSHSEARVPRPARPAGETGACCLEDPPVCYENLSSSSCQVLGGEWLGPGSTCDDCNSNPNGACCFNGGDCIDATAGFCEAADGVWLGPDTTCAQDGDKCRQADPIGACCLFTSCIDATESTCITIGGFWLGPDTECVSDSDECTAQPIYVPENFSTIQGAIDAAVDGAEISVAAGVYGGTGGAAVDLAGKQIWLHSRQGAALTFITGGGVRRVLESSLGEGNYSLIEGFTLLGGASTDRGGGIHLTNDGSPVFEDCVIRDNAAINGGGCAVLDGSPRFLNCDFIGNIASDYGGAVEVRGTGYPQFIGCFIAENVSALLAGRAAVNVRDGANAFIEDSTICGNLPEQILGDWVDGGGNEICQCPADVTGDGVIDGFDLTDLLAWWGACSSDCPYDFDASGTVDGADLLVVLSAWGSCPS